MSCDQPETEEMTVDGNESVGVGDPQPPVTTAAANVISSHRLMLKPNIEHKPDNYDDLELEFSSCVLGSLEKYLPLDMLRSNKEEKAKFMSDILLKYISRKECSIAIGLKDHKQKIASNYRPLHMKLYALDPSFFCTPSFLKAIQGNTEESFRSIICEPFPGIYVFKMLKPNFCKMMIAEVRNFRNWAKETNFKIKKSSNMNQYGTVLDHIGLDSMLDKLMENFICPVSKVFFSDVGGTTLDSHHGSVSEYGKDRDADLSFHVDNSEVTLNVCLGKQFEGGELYFRGIRCQKHVNTLATPEESFDYCHKPGEAVLYRGRHRHGARTTTSGHRINMVLWCKSSLFRETKSYEHSFTRWCGQCSREDVEKQMQILASKRKEMIRIEN